jgi:hypothetical protein
LETTTTPVGGTGQPKLYNPITPKAVFNWLVSALLSLCAFFLYQGQAQLDAIQADIRSSTSERTAMKMRLTTIEASRYTAVDARRDQLYFAEQIGELRKDIADMREVAARVPSREEMRAIMQEVLAARGGNP